MNLHRTILATALALLAGNAAAATPTPASSGLWPVPANRIVGLWQVEVTLAPCAGGPAQTRIAYNIYHAGGTLSDTNADPPTARGPGQGIWQYQGHRQYKTRFQFYRYLPDGSYNGITDVQTDVYLDAQSTQYSQTVYARNLGPNGNLQVELCGSAVGERVDID